MYLDTISPAIAYLTQLRYLDLSYNQLTEINIWTLDNLEYVDLSHNELRALPSDILLLVKLQNLNLSHNNFQNLPPEIGQLPNIIGLNIRGNPLDYTALPSEITVIPQMFWYQIDLEKLPF